MYALYCPILEQCKVSPSPSKKIYQMFKRKKGGGGQWRFEQCLKKTAGLVKRYIPKVSTIYLNEFRDKTLVVI